jgi:hypothetical protein
MPTAVSFQIYKVGLRKILISAFLFRAKLAASDFSPLRVHFEGDADFGDDDDGEAVCGRAA